jgi:hypothetical protein
MRQDFLYSAAEAPRRWRCEVARATAGRGWPLRRVSGRRLRLCATGRCLALWS